MRISRDGIVLWGDSVFFGYGASCRNKGCARLLKRRLSGRRVIVKARNLTTSRDALRNIESDVLSAGREAFGAIVILFGNNDARLIGKDAPAVGLGEYKDNIMAILNILKNSYPDRYIANLQPIDEARFIKAAPSIAGNMENIKNAYSWHAQYSDACYEVAKIAAVPLIDIRTPLESCRRDIFFDDGMHPNDEGHSIICETMFEALNQNREAWAGV